MMFLATNHPNRNWRKIARWTLIVCVIGLCLLYIIRHFEPKQYTAEQKQEYVDRICEMADVPALSVAIWDGDTETYLHYSGDGEEVNELTAYELASTSKAFTGLGILQLEQQGLISLSDPVQRYIPDFRPTWQGEEIPITIEQLLTHTSGIPTYALDLIPEQPYTPGGLSESLSGIFDIRLDFQPGSKHSYSTVNYDFLALVIETVTGQGFEEYITANVLEPAEMTDSFFRSDAVQENVTPGSRTAFLRTVPYNAPVYYGNTAAGYLISTPRDLMKWMKQVKTLFDFSAYPITDDNPYYAGWNIDDDFVCHGGNNPNYCSYVIIDRDRDLGVFALSSKSGAIASVIAYYLYQMMCGETVKIDFYGLLVDYMEILDLLCLIAPMLLTYLILWIPTNTRKKAIIRLVLGSLVLGILLAVPAISHTSWRFSYVWGPGSLNFLVGFCLLFSLYLIGRSIIYLAKR